MFHFLSWSSCGTSSLIMKWTTSTAFIGRASKTETYTGIRKGVVTTQY